MPGEVKDPTKGNVKNLKRRTLLNKPSAQYPSKTLLSNYSDPNPDHTFSLVYLECGISGRVKGVFYGRVTSPRLVLIRGCYTRNDCAHGYVLCNHLLIHRLKQEPDVYNVTDCSDVAVVLPDVYARGSKRSHKGK